METNGWFYDGENAARYQVFVTPGDGGPRILFGDGNGLDAPADLLTHVESRRDCEIYGRSDVPGWRLGMTNPVAPGLRALLPQPQKYGRWIDRIGLAPALLLFAAASAVLVFAGSRFPAWAAPYVSEAWEETYGDALVGDFGGKFCNNPDGARALNRLVARLAPNAASLNVRVVDIGLVNAAAFPGGNIVIFDELLKEARGPEEVAGVLAHEMAHIEKRHVTQAMIRELGLGMIVSAFGGSVGGNVDTLLAARYSRNAEREADAGAIAILARANISPVPTSAFFDRLARQEEMLGRFGQGLAYISTHPLSKERQLRYRRSAIPDHRYGPVLEARDWTALADICSSGGAPVGSAT